MPNVRGTEPVVSTSRPSILTGATIDALEVRRLFSANLEVTRTLVIDATPGNDTISVDLDIGLFGERTLRVTENGAVTGTFAQDDVVDILVLCGDGNDFVRIGSGGASGTTHSVTRPDQITGGSLSTPVQIEGGAGNDTLNGGAGNDTIFGGDGDDFIDGYDGDDFVDAGAGNDTVIMDYGADTVFGGPGDDQLNGQETGKGSTIDGGDGNDQITGNSHKDVIHGGAGNDLIDGGRGADRIFGGDGADRITINAKNARIRGEGGADVFLEGVAKGRKSLKDFLSGEDSIQPVVTPGIVQSAIVQPTTFSDVKVDDTLKDDIANLLV